MFDYNKLKSILSTITMRKFLIFVFFILASNAQAISKETTYKKELFDKALSEGKVVVVSSWIKYCTSCASQMKILNKAKNDFDNIEYFAFDVTNKEIAKFFNVQYQTTLLIFKDNKEVYRSLGETTKELIYDALKSSI
jgi:thiol-disulfide isomerase/thioredoxin